MGAGLVLWPVAGLCTGLESADGGALGQANGE